MDSLGEKPSGRPARVDQPQVDPARHRGAPESQAATNAPSERFPKSMRVHSRRDFDDLFKNGRVIVDQVLVVHGRTSNGAGRIGISISKRVGHSPFRNRWKRLIREAYRRLASRSPALARLDLVVRPRRGAVPTYVAIERSLSSLASRLDRQLGRHERDSRP